MAISSPSLSYPCPRCGCRCRSITAPVLPDELVWEILSWLPVKSLMRFKSVQRIWRSIILDPDFARVHQRRGAFKGLLISDSSGNRRAPSTNFYYMSPEAPANHILHHATVTAGGAGIGVTMGSTNQVDGLVCFYYRNRSLLYNVATGESLRLPDSIDEFQACSYHLGFDPVNKLYKLVKICPIYDRFDDNNPFADEEFAVFRRNSNCEILTFGEEVKDAPLSWRNIDSPPPPWEILSQCVCYDGVLYWMERVVRSGWRQHLIAFDLSKEIFYIFSPAKNHGCYNLARFGPGVCLDSHEILERIINCYYRGNGGGGESVSTESRLNIPLWDPPDLMGILPNGKLLLHDTYICSFPDWRYYLYDPSNRALVNIVVPRVIYPTTTTPSSSLASPELDVRFTSYYEENIVSLRALIS